MPAMSATISTARLKLIPMTPDFLRASLAGDLLRAEHIIGLSLPEGWPDAPSFLSLRLRQLEEDLSRQPWLVRAIGLRTSGAMIGHIGFHAAPGADEILEAVSPGAAEFGYTVLPAFRRQGYAEESSRALIEWARREHGVTKFVVSISPDNHASQAMAAKLGFIRIGSQIDEADGLEEILQLIVA
jgi:ribosomal-protein-alanine N-acetyltransferase